MIWLRRLAAGLFVMYLAVFPGSTLTVALDQVPAWGSWMGAALLLVQGAAALCWLLGYYGRRGALVALLVALLAWAVEHIGVYTGLPFGRYTYTAQLQPQLLGVVPLPIVAAWLMATLGAWQLAGWGGWPRWARMPAAATLVLLLDLQIETVATLVNRYWVWLDSGPYYGVPTANFIAWWLVGLAAALICAGLLPQNLDARRVQDTKTSRILGVLVSWWLAFKAFQMPQLPAALYLLSTLMFMVVNLARGYTLAGLVGAAVLGLVASARAARRTGG